MFHALAPLCSNPPKFNPRPALENPAVARCQIASERAFRTEMKMTKSRMLARKEARDAFRCTLPPLSALMDIADFIACVAFATSTGVFVDGECAEFLYAAQIALKSSALQSRREMLRSKTATYPSPPLLTDSNRRYKRLSGINLENKELANVKIRQKRPKSAKIGRL